MKRTALLSFVAGLTLLCPTASFAQTAGFTFAFTNGGCNPDSVVFTNTSTGAHTYKWDFGDFGPNDTSTAVNPYYNYLWDQTYIATLTAYDTISGDSDITNEVITIGFTPWLGWAWFFADPNPVCPGDETGFMSFMFPPPTFTIWDFGDGDSSTATQPSHAYADTGTYMATFIAGNSCGTDTAFSMVMVDTNAAISASWWATPTPACPGQPITFTNNTFPDPISQIWDFGDGDSATTFDAFHTYPDTGTYSVTLIVFSSCNSDTLTSLIIVDDSLMPSVSASASSNPVCPGDDVNFSSFGANLQYYLWDFGDSSVSLQEDPTHAFADTGSYDVLFIGTNYCGFSDTDTVVVTVGDSIPPTFMSWFSDPSSFCSTSSGICPGTPVGFNNNTPGNNSWDWDFGDGDTSDLFEPVHAFPDTGTYNVTLIATSSCDGIDTLTKCVYVVDDATPNAFFCTNPFCFPPSVICPGTAVFFTNNSSDTAQSFWDFGDGDTSIVAEPMHVFTDTGSFTVLLEVTNSCGNVDYWAETIVVTYNAAPPNHIIQAFPSIACPGEVIDFSIFIPPFFFPIDTADVLWDFGDGNTSNATNPNYSYDTSGTFNVSVIVFTACGNDTAYTSVTIKPGSSPDFTYTSVCLGDSVQFTDASTGSPESYSWDFGDGDTSTVQSPLHEFDSAGVTYMVSLTVVDSGCVSSITKPVTVGATSLITSVVNANCGQADGQASVVPSGGTPPYTYSWDDPGSQTNATATGLAAGPYQVIVEDAIGCLDTANVVVGDDAGGLALIFSTTNVSCFGLCDGTATATIAGGTPPYTYGWADPLFQTDVTAFGLCAGSYDVTITDAVGCQDVATATILEPALLVASIPSTTSPSCNGFCDGTATGSVTGGTPPYTYLWGDPATQTTVTAMGLCAASYDVTVTDNNGCISVSSVVVITEPTVLALSMDSINASCGNADGSAIVTVSGATAPYTYLWDDPGTQTTDTASVLASGTYTVAVEDNNGCLDTGTVVVNDIAGPSASISGITSVSCFGGNDGSATGSAAGGTSPYTYAWDDPGAQTTATATGLLAGSYEVTVTDNIGCQDSASAVITQPGVLSLTPDSVAALCFGDCNGQAIVTPAGGTAPYTYLWNDPFSQVTAMAISLCAGTYCVTVTDNNGCQDSVCIIVAEPPLLVVAVDSLDATGFSVCDGKAWTIPTGGSGPYTYIWNDPATQTTDTAFALCAGTYCVTVTDSLGCTNSACPTIIEPPLLTATITGFASATCSGACDGDATVTAGGGVPPYTYAWDDPGTQTNATATGLCAGTVNVTVTDNNGNTATTSIGITEPTALVATITGSNNAGCNGACDGDATVSFVGGSAPYTYSWDDPSTQTTTTATGLCAGSYNFVVVDASGCTDTATVIITEPALLIASISAFNDASCNGLCDGDATAAAAGGTSPYAYLWDDPTAQTNAMATGLCTGTYNCIITDANSCVDTIAQVISEPPAIVLIMGTADATCGVPNGEASVSASGGSGPLTYLWDDPGTQTTDTATALAAGGYSIDVTDSIGCIETGVATVNNAGAATVSIASITHVSCNGGNNGNTTVSAVGGTPPYTYAWDDPGTQTNATATGLLAGTYVATVTDAAACIGSAIAIVTEPTLLVSSMASNDATCFGVCNGDATVSPSGGTAPYTYSWNDPSTQTNAMATSLCAGSYDVAVTDSNGCVDSSSVVITEPSLLTASISSSSNVSCNGACDGLATLTAGGGITPYTYLWDDPGTQTTATATGLCAGTFIVNVQDNNGCATADTIVITEPAVLSASITGSTNIDCNAACNGDATGSVSGGNAPYTYLWDDPSTQTNLIATGLCAGTYNLVITDSLGCSDVATAVISEPSALSASISGSNNVTCNAACNGNATGSASGGTLPFTYLWDDPSAQTNLSASNLCAGTFNFMVTDANGCVDSASVVITEPSTLVASISASNNATCNTACDGDATASGSGGVAPYGYLWDDPSSQTTLTASSLCAGSYNVIVSDVNGCMATATVVITEPSAIVLTTASTDATCGVSNGSASVSASGGTGSYIYLWDDPSAQTNDTATALSANGYSVTVTDSLGCSVVGVTSVNNTGAATVSISSVVDLSCNGDSSGSATVLATGGSPPYTYSWDDPASQTNTSAVGLSGGTYVATVTDSVSCIASAIAIVLEPAVLSLSTSSNSASCFGACDGDATVTPSGGTAPYTYLWTMGCSAPTCGVLCAGTYGVTVTDANGCMMIDSVTILEPVALAASVTTINPSCAGTCDGSGTASASGGTPPYNYLWTDSLGDSVALGTSVAGLCAGNYSLIVTDGNGCTNTAAFTLTDPVGMTLTFASTPASCGATDGVASVSITNGTAPYTYLWDDPFAQLTDTITTIAAGTYNVIVTDANGCMVSGATTVGNAGAPSVSIVSTDVTCNAACNGTSMITVTGGATPYTYLWDDPGTSTNASVSSLCAGIFTAMVTDSNGCVAFASDTIVEPPALVLITLSTAATCNGACDASATVLPSGGVAPYTYLWDDPSAQATPTANGLCAGTYVVIVSDANACMDSAIVVLVDPAAITLSTVSADATSCGACDGSITASASGGTGSLAYLWDDGAAQTNAVATNLCAGIYTVLITDANGCTSTASDTVNSPGGLIASISSSNDASCNAVCDGDATAAASGGTSPFTYLWDDGATQTNATAIGLCAGSYNCLITDNTGCSSSASVTITEPASAITATVAVTDASCSGVCDGSTTLTTSGGTSPYTYLWDDPSSQTNANATGLCGGSISVIITDSNACTLSVSDSIGETGGMTVSTISTDATTGQSDGDITATVSGGTAPYTYLWNDPSSQATASATGLLAGLYTCAVTDANGCTATGIGTISESVGIDDVNMNILFDIYPNPTNGMVTLSIRSAVQTDFKVHVQNLIGEILLETSYGSRTSVKEELNLGTLPNGVYFIKIASENGTANRRIVVAR